MQRLDRRPPRASPRYANGERAALAEVAPTGTFAIRHLAWACRRALSQFALTPSPSPRAPRRCGTVCCPSCCASLRGLHLASSCAIRPLAVPRGQGPFAIAWATVAGVALCRGGAGTASAAPVYAASFARLPQPRPRRLQLQSHRARPGPILRGARFDAPNLFCPWYVLRCACAVVLARGPAVLFPERAQSLSRSRRPFNARTRPIVCLFPAVPSELLH